MNIDYVSTMCFGEECVWLGPLWDHSHFWSIVGLRVFTSIQNEYLKSDSQYFYLLED